MSIDPDGDIRIGSDRGTLYVTREAIILTNSSSTLGSIIAGQDTLSISAVLDEVFTTRSSFLPSRYVVRLFLRLRFNDDVPVLVMEPNYFAKFVREMSPDLPASNVKQVQCNVTYSEGAFNDAFETTIEPRQLDLRFSRQGAASEHASFNEFLISADVISIAKRTRVFIEPLIVDPSKIR